MEQHSPVHPMRFVVVLITLLGLVALAGFVWLGISWSRHNDQLPLVEESTSPTALSQIKPNLPVIPTTSCDGACVGESRPTIPDTLSIGVEVGQWKLVGWHNAPDQPAILMQTTEDPWLAGFKHASDYYGVVFSTNLSLSGSYSVKDNKVYFVPDTPALATIPKESLDAGSLSPFKGTFELRNQFDIFATRSSGQITFTVKSYTHYPEDFTGQYDLPESDYFLLNTVESIT